MDKTLGYVIVVLALMLILAAACYAAYRKIKRKIRRFSRMAFGTSTIGEGIDRMEAEYAATPKSISAGTGLYLPRIARDFPEFHYEEMRERAENVLVSYLRSLDAMNGALLTEGTEELRGKLAMRLGMLRAQGIRVHYDGIKVHRTEIHRYRKEKARCSVIFQSAVEYVYYEEKDGNTVAGRRERKTQSKYNTELIYIQDRELVENTKDTALGLNCPNCGAPLSGTGAKVCAYCDTPVVEFNIRAWNFGGVEEVR